MNLYFLSFVHLTQATEMPYAPIEFQVPLTAKDTTARQTVGILVISGIGTSAKSQKNKCEVVWRKEIRKW